MMKKITIRDLARLTGAEVVNAEVLKRRPVFRVSTDSRTVGSGDLFVALKGEKFDAHDFMDDVLKAEPAVVIVQRSWAAARQQYFRSYPTVFVIVEETTAAFGELARLYRRKFDIPVIAIAGSNGKTTTKEMVTAVLRTKYEVLATEGNLNNHIGVPQTLFRLSPLHDAAVVEIGTNHFGELEYLCRIAEPTHGLITNIGKEHLEFFGDEEGVAKEERELFRWLKENDGIALVNADDPFLVTDAGTKKKWISYGVSAKADIRARSVKMLPAGTAQFDTVWRKKEITVPVRLNVPGEHNIINALAAASVGLRLKVKPKKIAAALASFTSANKRMEVFMHNGIVVLNDTYNSNPDSVMAALRTLAGITVTGKKFVVLGDMRELGDASKREHTGIGAAAAGMKFQGLLTFGPFSKYTCEAYGSGAVHFEAKDALSAALKERITAGDAVLIKGSRGMRMEEVVAYLTGTQSKDGH